MCVNRHASCSTSQCWCTPSAADLVRVTSLACKRLQNINSGIDKNVRAETFGFWLTYSTLPLYTSCEITLFSAYCVNHKQVTNAACPFFFFSLREKRLEALRTANTRLTRESLHFLLIIAFNRPEIKVLLMWQWGSVIAKHFC